MWPPPTTPSSILTPTCAGCRPRLTASTPCTPRSRVHEWGGSMNDPVLQAFGLVRSYGKTPALCGLSVTIASGEIVAVTGPSGCGKSTLLHCLAGIITPDAGFVHFRGQSLGRMSERE